MRYLQGIVRDDETYVTTGEYRDLIGTAASEPGGENAAIEAYARQATALFDKITGRDRGRWLKSRPMELRVNGTGHYLLHSPAPIQALKNISSEKEGILAVSPYVEIPSAEATPSTVFYCYAREIGSIYDDYQIQISNVSTTFDLSVLDPDNNVLESFSGLSMDFQNAQYCRRQINQNSDYIVLEVHKSVLPDAGTYTLADGWNIAEIQWGTPSTPGLEFLAREDGSNFNRYIHDITIQGEIGDALEPPPIVKFAISTMIELMRRDLFREARERRIYEGPGREISFEGLTGSPTVDAILEQYKVKSWPHVLDIG